MKQTPPPFRTSLTTTVIATACIMLLSAAMWVSAAGPQVVSLSDIVLSTVLVGSMIFPLAHMWVRARHQRKAISAQFLLWMSILWMMVAVIGIAANLWNGLSDASTWGVARNIEFWAVLVMFSGMFVSSLVQLATAADWYVKESEAAYGFRHRTA